MMLNVGRQRTKQIWSRAGKKKIAERRCARERDGKLLSFNIFQNTAWARTAKRGFSSVLNIEYLAKQCIAKRNDVYNHVILCNKVFPIDSAFNINHLKKLDCFVHIRVRKKKYTGLFQFLVGQPIKPIPEEIGMVLVQYIRLVNFLPFRFIGTLERSY